MVFQDQITLHPKECVLCSPPTGGHCLSQEDNAIGGFCCLSNTEGQSRLRGPAQLLKSFLGLGTLEVALG